MSEKQNPFDALENDSFSTFQKSSTFSPPVLKHAGSQVSMPSRNSFAQSIPSLPPMTPVNQGALITPKNHLPSHGFSLQSYSRDSFFGKLNFV